MVMSVSVMKQVLENTDSDRISRISKIEESINYYKNQNDITRRNNGESVIKKDGKNELLRSADNRISNNFHKIIVDQEASYLTTKRPQIDVDDNDDLNQKVDKILGDYLPLTLNQLVINACNAGAAWIHYWTNDKGFDYSVVDSSQITPIYDKGLKNHIVAIRRSYRQLDTDSGKYVDIHEYWDDKTCTSFKSNGSLYTGLETNDVFDLIDNSTNEVVGNTNVYEHGLGRIPFIKFAKNVYEQRSLDDYKGLIDAYDSVYNGYLNDLDDIQQVILVLKNYGDTSLSELKEQLKKYSAVKFESDEAGSGLDTLNIEIPREARDDMLEITRSEIFLKSKSVDPSKTMISNATATAIKQLQSQLEEKASLTEQYFSRGLAELVRAILQYLNVPNYLDIKVAQKWTRNTVTNVLEQAQALAQVASFTSKETIAKNNPFVEDYQAELESLKDDSINSDGYGNQSQIDNLSKNPNKDKVDE
ncbi:phage portal protein [Apilactobacillus xinyiensis]|uniref:phage portal protein n=1 Tax=Apilactobacillus xinyiensis TaxID=2841032 RepID=UPI00200C3D8F|nr:phage portal protein [Apilactobacillus xinyiensis]MCL0330601.1 phage portal protein [Apilactobacillus xinyiensis]